jgi:hypothetical protein
MQGTPSSNKGHKRKNQEQRHGAKDGAGNKAEKQK